jgi:hypothetical protein
VTGSEDSGSTGKGSSGNQQAPSSGDDTCTTCSDDSSVAPVETDDASVGSDDSSAPATGDDGSTGTTPPPFMFPPVSLPEAGSSTDDGGANSCTTKICIDPVFDCPLQGCFNGCVNLHCM